MAYADAFGEAGGFGTMSYYLASGFEKVCAMHEPLYLGLLPPAAVGSVSSCYVDVGLRAINAP